MSSGVDSSMDSSIDSSMDANWDSSMYSSVSTCGAKTLGHGSGKSVEC